MGVELFPYCDSLGDNEEGKACIDRETIQNMSFFQRDELREAFERRVAAEVVPEYERGLEHVLLTIEPAADLEKVYGDFVMNLPPYTHINVVFHRRSRSKVIQFFRDMGIEPSYLHLQAVDRDQDIEVWSQDYTDLIQVGGRDQLLLTMEPGEVPEDLPEENRKWARRVNARVRLFKELLPSENYLQVPFFFEGGNMAYDRTDDGRLRVFIGVTDILLTQRIYNYHGEILETREIVNAVSNYLGGAEVVMMGARQIQPSELFHLDHSFVILDDHTVVMLTCGQADDAAEELAAYRTQFESLGYRIFEVPTSLGRLKAYKGSLNAIPFVDRRNGQKKIMFPVYEEDFRNPDLFHEDLDYFREHPIQAMDLTNEALYAYHAFSAAGYTPIPVRNFTAASKGSLHCISNVLAQRWGDDNDDLKVAEA